MGKHEPGSLKAIGNRIKAKGLQKLKWYCQMCQKQCRDENGFKCHCMSESHQRQLLVFADNPTKFVDQFSKEFETTFLEMVKHRFGTRRVKANDVYKEFISDRHHLHMNSTCWPTLTDFVIYLGRSGKCTVDQTPKGWYFCYIDRDPRTLARQAELEKKERMDKSDDDKAAQMIEAQRRSQIEQEGGLKERSEATDLIRPATGGTMSFGLKVSAPVSAPRAAPPKFEEAPAEAQAPEKSKEKRKLSAMQQLAEEHQKQKEKKNRTNYWLIEGIQVKVLNKQLLEGEVYKKKGVITKLESSSVAVVKMNETGKKLRLDQHQLETVIPNPGGHVMVVNGAYRGSEAVVKRLDIDRFQVEVEISGGAYKGQQTAIDYEDVSKMA